MPLFDQDEGTDSTELIRFKRAVAVNDTKEERYLLLLPTESTNNAQLHVNDNYTLVVEDYSHNTNANDLSTVYLKWRYAGANPAGGMVIHNNILHFVERRFSSFTTDVEYNLYHELKSGDPRDICRAPA